MASKLDVLKRYASKKKKAKKTEETDKLKKPTDAKNETISATSNPDLSFLERTDDANDAVFEAEENPSLFFEDGVTAVPPDFFKKTSVSQGKWIPLGGTPADTANQTENKLPNIQTRHDSESEEDIVDAKTTIKPYKPISTDVPTQLYKPTPVTPILQKYTKKEENVNKVEDVQWGPGCYQSVEKKLKIEEIAHEMQKPLARYKDDKDLEKHLKSIVRDEDPLKNFVSKPEPSEPSRKLADKELTSKHYFYNRFNIAPGCRWDGADRSNSFEKRWLARRNEVVIQEQEAFMFFAEEI